MKPYKPQLARLQKKLNAKLIQLEQLKQKYQATDSLRSRASFAGKITRCQRDIDIIKERIKKLYG